MQNFDAFDRTIVRLKASAGRLNPCGRTSKMPPRRLDKR